MSVSTLSSRSAGLLAATALIGGLTACATEVPLEIASPTMAPEQSVDEACAISGEDIDRITRETEEQLRAGIDQAGADLAAGRIPSFEFLAGPIDEAVAEVEAQISNAEVVEAIGRLRAALQGFGEIERPESLLSTPGYVAALGAQLNEVVNAGSELQSLCIVDSQ